MAQEDSHKKLTRMGDARSGAFGQNVDQWSMIVACTTQASADKCIFGWVTFLMLGFSTHFPVACGTNIIKFSHPVKESELNN
jgi:hypothetical protein